MKKLKVLMVIVLTILFCIPFCSFSYANTNVKSLLTIDTNLENAIFDRNGIHISGWKLSTESNTKLIVLVDEQKIQDEYIKYSYKYDLISIVKGYGTYEENPLPMFDIDIPTTNISEGKHDIKIQFILEDGTILEEVKKSITIDKKIKHALNIDTDLNNVKFDKDGIKISGWRLATEKNKIAVFIDGQEVSEEYITYTRKYDLISIVKGYGTYEENPLPMFDIDIPTTNISEGEYNIKIQFILEDGTILEEVKKSITIDKKIKHALNIDTDLNNVKFDKDGIKISGWRLATEKNKIVVLIDGQEVSEEYITYTRKYDLISIVKGYGTYDENPTPMFDVNIPTYDIADGKHSIEIQLKLDDDTVLEKVNSKIVVEKVKHVLNIDTNLNNAEFDKYGIKISGWRLATEKNKIAVLIDGQEVSEEYITYTCKYDLISIVKGYGTYDENPTPMFDVNIPTYDIADGKHSITIQLRLEDNTIIESVEKNIFIDKKIKSILNIDTNLNTIVFNELKNIKISGWKLATEANTKLLVYIDGKKAESCNINYSRTYDLISIVKGYGTYEENPMPMFEIEIQTEKLSKQNHNMKIQYMSAEGEVLKSVEFVAVYGDKFKGIDVSEKNGQVNWKEIAKSGIDFAMIRIGYRGYRNPILVLDKQALYNLKEAKAVGIKVGVYFVTQAVDLNEAQEEALWVVSQLHQNGIKLDYPIAIDTEDSGARANGYLPGRADLLDIDTRTMLCRAFCDVIKYQEFIPAIYASKDWFINNLNYEELENYDIWVAHYTYNEDILTNFSKEYQIWQYSDKGNINGISSQYVDLNICYKKY